MYVLAPAGAQATLLSIQWIDETPSIGLGTLAASQGLHTASLRVGRDAALTQRPDLRSCTGRCCSVWKMRDPRIMLEHFTNASAIYCSKERPPGWLEFILTNASDPEGTLK